MPFETVYVSPDTGTPVPTATMKGYLMENCVQFSRGYAAVGKFTIPKPMEDEVIVNDRLYAVDIAISGRLVSSRMLYADTNSAPENQGRVLMMVPGSRVRISTPAGELRSMHCVLEGSMIDELLDRKPEWNQRQIRSTANVDNLDVEWLLLKIYRELRQPGFASGLMVEELANAICVEVIRNFSLDKAKDAFRIGGLPPWRLRLLRERAYADAPAPSLAELADLCDLSIRQLRRAFMAETGRSIGKFITAATIDRARTLLTDTGHSISDVANKLGFADASSFCHAFRRATGLRPSEVKKHTISRRCRL